MKKENQQLVYDSIMGELFEKEPKRWIWDTAKLSPEKEEGHEEVPEEVEEAAGVSEMPQEPQEPTKQPKKAWKRVRRRRRTGRKALKDWALVDTNADSGS